MTGTISVQDLRLNCIIGILDAERRTPQELVVELEMDYDIQETALSARIEEAIDYAKATELLTSFLQDASFQLLETLVYRSIYFLHEHFPQAVRVQVKAAKPQALGGRGVPAVRAEQRFDQRSEQ
ncbi:MAG TPA: dihydroneopterin aldolase [Spirochaetia bacterium]|nr:dihydroneopterin aldolase [Spirochaetia bacterium]